MHGEWAPKRWQDHATPRPPRAVGRSEQEVGWPFSAPRALLHWALLRDGQKTSGDEGTALGR
eukprot:10747-Pyramimonas_sp.AAC.1